MHRFLLNSAVIQLTLRPRSGFLVKAGGKGTNLLHPERPDMYALRTLDPQGRETVFIPGSSIKGVVRSACERLLRGLVEGDGLALACDPLSRDSRCQPQADQFFRRHRKGATFEEKAAVYRGQCYACRTFGSQSISSRVRFEDALPTLKSHARANKTSLRSGVAIDRKSGGPSSGKLYNLEVVTGGDFQVRIQLENVQLWQLAMVAAVLDDMNDGITRLGSAKTRGLGVFDVGLQSVMWRQQGGGQTPAGVGRLLSRKHAEAHGMVLDDALTTLPSGAQARPGAIWTRWDWQGEHAWSLLHAVQDEPWRALVKHVEAQR